MRRVLSRPANRIIAPRPRRRRDPRSPRFLSAGHSNERTANERVINPIRLPIRINRVRSSRCARRFEYDRMHISNKISNHYARARAADKHKFDSRDSLLISINQPANKDIWTTAIPRLVTQSAAQRSRTAYRSSSDDQHVRLYPDMFERAGVYTDGSYTAGSLQTGFVL
jgi:hypothetical protein